MIALYHDWLARSNRVRKQCAQSQDERMAIHSVRFSGQNFERGIFALSLRCIISRIRQTAVTSPAQSALS
jgi:hypothetical protein